MPSGSILGALAAHLASFGPSLASLGLICAPLWVILASQMDPQATQKWTKSGPEWLKVAQTGPTPKMVPKCAKIDEKVIKKRVGNVKEMP